MIRREAGRAIHLSNLFQNPYQAPLARKLVEWSGLDRVFFTNSGTEAIDGALKLARAYAHAQSKATGAAAKTRILALENSFHGRTFGALSITYPAKYREPFAPLVPGVEFVRFNDVADLEAKFDNTVCALVLETIQGEGGIFPVSEAFWQRARTLATQNDAALIADEIQCGLGRTGRHFAYQKFSSLPGYPRIGKAARRRTAAWRHHRQRKIRVRIRPRNAWHHIRRRPADLRHGAGISERDRRRKSAREHSRTWRGIARRESKSSPPSSISSAKCAAKA